MMFDTREVSQWISIICFAWYGMACFLSKRMETEFRRYRFSRYRKLTGSLQVAASLGLFIGFYFKPLLLASSLGLALMMFVAMVIRVKIQDPFYTRIPAFLFFMLNSYIFCAAF